MLCIVKYSTSIGNIFRNRSRNVEIRASFKPDLRFVDVAFHLVPILQRRNPYGMYSPAGAWRREMFKL